MAPFTKRQVGYIKAIAGVGQHKSFINYLNHPPSGGWPSGAIDTTMDATGDYNHINKFIQSPQYELQSIASAANFYANKKLSGALYCLNNIPVTIDHTSGSTTAMNDLDFKQCYFEKILPPNKMLLLSSATTSEGDEPTSAAANSRIGEDFYLESTHIRWRFTMPDFTVVSGKQPHHEYRFIVFRQRKPTVQRGFAKDTTHGQWLNWNYDLFSGYMGRRVGFEGYRKHEEFDDGESYAQGPRSAYTANGVTCSHKLNTDDVMTMPLNDADYVIMRDERFFLGAEHGKSHYETVTRFDWSDQGSTSQYNMVEGLDDSKNYDWWFLILGTTNDDQEPRLDIQIRATTAVTSA